MTSARRSAPNAAAPATANPETAPRRKRRRSMYWSLGVMAEEGISDGLRISMTRPRTGKFPIATIRHEPVPRRYKNVWGGVFGLCAELRCAKWGAELFAGRNGPLGQSASANEINQCAGGRNCRGDGQAGKRMVAVDQDEHESCHGGERGQRIERNAEGTIHFGPLYTP